MPVSQATRGAPEGALVGQDTGGVPERAPVG